MNHPRKILSALIGTLLAVILIFAIVPFVQAPAPATRSFGELLDRSEKERKGLMFYVKDQTSGGAVVKINADSAMRSLTYNRVVIRLDSIDAVAIN
jgi:hypothetical protein